MRCIRRKFGWKVKRLWTHKTNVGIASVKRQYCVGGCLVEVQWMFGAPRTHRTSLNLDDFDDLFADVLARQKPHEGLGCVFQPLGNVFDHFDITGGDFGRDFLHEFRELAPVI